jgi:hypothetical protein
MGKRKRRFENKTNRDLVNEIDWYLKNISWSSGHLYLMLSESLNTKRDKPLTDEAVVEIQNDIKQCRKLLGKLMHKIEGADLILEPQRNITKGKGKLNLHETDKELRQREANSNYYFGETSDAI